MANSQVAGFDAIQAPKANEITVGDTAPVSPTTGWMWVDTSGTPQAKMWDGSAWIRIGKDLSAITPTTVEPDLGGTVGTSQNVSREDHRHDLTNIYGPVGQITSSTPGDTPDDGNDSELARADHAHGVPKAWEVLESGQKFSAGQFVLSGFDTSYQMYRLYMDIQMGGTTDGYLRMAIGGGGSGDFANYDYWRWDHQEDGTIAGGVRQQGATNWQLMDQTSWENSSFMLDVLFIRTDGSNQVKIRADLMATLSAAGVASNDVWSRSHGRYGGSQLMNYIEIDWFGFTSFFGSGNYSLEGLKL